MAIRILSLIETTLLRESVESMLMEQSDIEIVASAPSVSQLLSTAQAVACDLVLLETGTNNESVVETVRLLRAVLPATNIVLMYMAPAQAQVLEYVRLGVSGVVLPDATREECLSTIRLVAAGSKVFPPSLVDSLIAHVSEIGRGGTDSNMRTVRMTTREREVMRLIAEGMSNKEIADRLQIAIHTVKTHVHNILEKLALDTRLQIANYVNNEETYGIASPKPLLSNFPARPYA